MHPAQSILSLGHNPTLLTYRHVLLRKAGYDVTSASHTIKALDLLSRRSFDLIVVGISAHSERVLIERLHHECGVPVIFLCCDRFDPTPGACKCHDIRLSPQEFLKKVAAALHNDVVN